MVFRDTRSAWFAVQLEFWGLLCCFLFRFLFSFPSLRIIDAVFGAKDIRLSAGDDQLFSQHRPLSYPSDGVGSLRQDQGYFSTGRLHAVSLSKNSSRSRRGLNAAVVRRAQMGAARPGMIRSIYKWRLPLAGMRTEILRMLSENGASEIRYD
jgi:hypothetical protein